MKERILALIAALHVTPNYFSTHLGFCRTFAKTLGNDITSKKVAKILTIYPEVNPYWLLMGKGDMFLSTEHFKNVDYKEMFEKSRKELEAVRQDNSSLRNQLIELSSQNTQLAKEICELKIVHNG